MLEFDADDPERASTAVSIDGATLWSGEPERDDRNLSEVWLWRQSNRLVAGEKVWEAAPRRDPTFTCAKLFWWYKMIGPGGSRRHELPSDGKP